MLANLSTIDKLLAQSWKDSPKGQNAKVDAVRRQVQNVVDLERALANREVTFGGFSTDRDGFDLIGEAQTVTGGKLTPRAAPVQTVVQAVASMPPPPPPDAVPDPAANDQNIPSSYERSFSAKALNDYAFTTLERLLREESDALVPTATALARDCDGSKP